MIGRYKKDISLSDYGNVNYSDLINDFLISRKYKLVSFNDFYLYQKGGMIRAPQYIMIQFNREHIHIEAWIRFTILPNVFVGEFDFKGYSGLYTRMNIAKDVKFIENEIIK